MHNTRVDPSLEALRSEVGARAHPVVPDPLICVEDEGVPLPGEDLDGVDDERLGVDAIGFDDGEVVGVDGEYPVWVAGGGHEAEAVA